MKRLTLFSLLIFFSCSKEDSEVTPTETIKYTVSITAGEGGTVSTSGGEYEKGTTLTISATANTGYEFEKWSDDNAENPRELIINSNIDLSANFILSCLGEKFNLPSLDLNSYEQRFLYHHNDIYNLLAEEDDYLGDHTTKYGFNSITVDYNNDNYLDFITFWADLMKEDRYFIKFYKNDCNGNLIKDELNSDKFLGLVHASKVITGDFNVDGYIDIVFIGLGYDFPPFPGEYPVILMSNGDETYTEKRLEQYTGTFHSGASGDIDNDGDLDIILTSGPNFSPFLINDGQGNFTFNDNIITENNRGTSRYTTEIYDLNNDGYEDIIIGGGESFEWAEEDLYNSSPPIIYFGPNYNGNIAILPHLELQFGSNIQNGSLQQNILTNLDFGFLDLDDDNIVEIIVFRTGNNYQGWHIQILKNNGDSFIDVSDSFIDQNFSEDEYPFGKLYIGDFDNDGTIEMVGHQDKALDFKHGQYNRWELVNGKFIKTD